MTFRPHPIVYALLIGLCYLPTQAQSTYIPLNDPAYHTIDRIEIKSDSLSAYLHTSVKPFVRLDAVLQAESADEANNARFGKTDRQYQYLVYKNNNEWSDFGLIESRKPFLKHFYRYKTDFLRIKDYGDFYMSLNPVLQLNLAKDNHSKALRFINTRGFEMRGMISEKLGFYAYLGENQSSYADYVQQNIKDNAAIPGEGRFKEFYSSVGDSLFAPGQDYFTARGYITFQPIERIRLQLGHDKNFIGNGIRSMLLSDEGNNYFFLKINTQVWRFSYQNLFMQLTGQFPLSTADTILPKKFAAMHHLSFNVNKRLNIGLFEGIVFNRPNNQFELAYLNPLIFYRAVEHELGSPDNVIIGLDYKLNLLRHLSLYGQLAIDEFKFSEIKNNTGWWANKMGWQAGIKYVDVAGISNLDAQLEYNSASPYTYSHHNSDGNYTHYNQALAHPLGANFREIIGTLQYRTFKQMQLKATLLYAQKGLDTPSDSSNWGGNIFLSNDTHEQDYGNALLQGNQSNILLADFAFSQMWKQNFFFDLGYTYRRQTFESGNSHTNHLFSAGIRINIARKQWLF
jgi:hypothetical protein